MVHSSHHFILINVPILIWIVKCIFVNFHVCISYHISHLLTPIYLYISMVSFWLCSNCYFLDIFNSASWTFFLLYYAVQKNRIKAGSLFTLISRIHLYTPSYCSFVSRYGQFYCHIRLHVCKRYYWRHISSFAWSFLWACSLSG